MNTIKRFFLLSVLFLGLHSAFSQTINPVISAIQKEVERNKSNLTMDGMAPPFFISYLIVDRHDYNLYASLGKIRNSNEYRQRRGVPNLLVGDYHRNNLNIVGGLPSPSLTSLYDNDSGIPLTIWRDLDAAYKGAAERYRTKMAMLQQQTLTPEEQQLPDLQQVEPVSMILQPANINFDKAYWENYLRKASETAKQYPDILNSSIALNVRNIMLYTYNTEGSSYAVPSTFYQLIFTASVRADDGQQLSRTIYVENATFEQMPDLATFSNRCKTEMENLLQLMRTPVVNDAYSGPVLFEDAAAIDIFRQAFFNNNRLAASPSQLQLQRTSGAFQGGNSFELMLNKKVISRDFTIKSITGQEFYNGQRLNGYYPIDAEGVIPDKELVLIEKGVLRNLLNGRRPTKKIAQSNGHVRYEYNNNSFQTLPGNILITSDKTFSRDELRKKLIEAAKEEDLEYAYIVKVMDGGGSNYIYRIYVDDGREELVRGATVVDAGNIKAFKRILGASNQNIITSFNSVQTTVIAPDAILFEEIDITRIPNIDFKKPFFVEKPK